MFLPVSLDHLKIIRDRCGRLSSLVDRMSRAQTDLDALEDYAKGSPSAVVFAAITVPGVTKRATEVPVPVVALLDHHRQMLDRMHKELVELAWFPSPVGVNVVTCEPGPGSLAAQSPTTGQLEARS